MTNIQSTYPWWRVQLEFTSFVQQVHLFYCSTYMPVTLVQLENCKSKYFSMTLYEEVTGGAVTWTKTIQSYTETYTDMVDNGYNNQDNLPGIVDIRLASESSTPQLYPHMAFSVGALGHSFELKSTLQPQKLAMAEVRIFGWGKGCPDEYTCDFDGGTCLERRYGQDFRKCVCNNGFEGQRCEIRLYNPTPLPTTWADGQARDL